MSARDSKTFRLWPVFLTDVKAWCKRMHEDHDLSLRDAEVCEGALAGFFELDEDEQLRLIELGRTYEIQRARRLAADLGDEAGHADEEPEDKRRGRKTG